jgi:hypothetical protein
MESGIVFDDAPVFRHVRGWLIMRCKLAEIPELGITIEDTEMLRKDSNASITKYYDRAGKIHLFLDCFLSF